MKLKRPLRGSESGADVRMVQRALRKVEDSFFPHEPTGTYGKRTQEAVRIFQMLNGLQATGNLGQQTLDALVDGGYFDAYGKWKYVRYKVLTAQDVTFNALLASMQEMSAKTPGYQLGGGHGIPLKSVSPSQKLDCSSSCSKALYDAGLFPDEYAWVSGRFAVEYGKPGPGKFFTVYANAEHVFIRLHKSRWWRFDTSPHGDGGRGPKLRSLPRFTSSFSVRHFNGM